jgi:hypothetical protein
MAGAEEAVVVEPPDELHAASVTAAAIAANPA